MKLKRPVLIGGLGLTAGLWMLDTLEHTPLDGSVMMGALALGSGLWWMKRHHTPKIDFATPKQVIADRSAVEQVLNRVDGLIETLISELPEEIQTDSQATIWQDIEAKRQDRQTLVETLTRNTIKLGLVGNKGTGKSALLSHLQSTWVAPSELKLTFDETVNRDGDVDVAIDTDLILFMIAGDLTESERQTIESLIAAGHQVLLTFNKQDLYQPMDRELVLERIKSRLQSMKVDVVAIATVPNPIKVRRHLENGEIEESLEQPAAETTALTQTLTPLLANNASQLVMATALRQAQALKRDVIQLINQQRRQKAMPLIEQMQWIAAGTAFANPLATLDLLASIAINSQLVIDLGGLYGQKFSVEQAKTAAGTLAELTVKLGLVELSTQVLGGLLKGHAATYVAGGALQGISAAYLTRLAGLAMIEFFEEQSMLDVDQKSLSFENLGDRLQTLFQQARQGLALQSFVTQALGHLPKTSEKAATVTA